MPLGTLSLVEASAIIKTLLDRLFQCWRGSNWAHQRICISADSGLVVNIIEKGQVCPI